jgi:hypothetical protein
MDRLTKEFVLPIFRTGYEGNGDGGGDGNGDGGGDGGGGSGEFTQADIDTAVEKAVGGLKTTNQALKGEKTEIKKTLDAMNAQFTALGGEDGIKKLSEFQKKLSEDESTSLLADGKHEEWFDKRTAALRKSHEKELGTVQEATEAANGRAEKAEARLHKTILKAEVLTAAKDAGTVAEASADIRLRAERVFTWDDERESLVVKDEDGDVVLSKDGKSPKSVAEWLDEQKEGARHWWPGSKGAGADGSGDGGEGGGDEDISTADYPTFAAKRKLQKAAKAKARGFA